MITERDRWVFDNLDKFDENEERTDMDVNTFFELMEEMVNRHYDAKEVVKNSNPLALRFHSQQNPSGHTRRRAFSEYG
ncbi:MAG: hypothetical protein K5918_02805 [Bacteroidales bacterium]|nr:hypothetical protein [Bacteroidales bacterium]